jgi:hypothetical protein
LRAPSFEDEVWPKLVAGAPSRKVVHAVTKKKRTKTLIERILLIWLTVGAVKVWTSEKKRYSYSGLE